MHKCMEALQEIRKEERAGGGGVNGEGKKEGNVCLHSVTIFVLNELKMGELRGKE